MEKKSLRIDEYIKTGDFYKAVVEDGTDIIFIVDYSGIIKYHNPSVELTLGHPPQSLINKVFFNFIHPDGRDKFMENFKNSTTKSFDSSVEFRFLCKDNTYKYLEFNSINLFDKNEVEGLILDCRDVTQRKKDAEELVKAQKAKQQFLANMSHEIRTPINGISGMATLLADARDENEQNKYLSAIRNSAESLKVIINDILDFSMIESGKMKLEKIGFTISGQLDTLYNTFIHQAREKDLDLSFEVDPAADIIVIGDPVRLNQILINLISNAMKFTHVGRVDINVGLKMKVDEIVHLSFEVSDTGVGIPQKKLSKIFDSFTQADASVTRRYGGTGLGLTITKQLIDILDGEIKVRSVENKGTTFTFTIPYQLGSEKDLPDNNEGLKSEETENLDGLRILLVEDNDVNRLYASRLLMKWESDVIEAENGNHAVELLKQNDFDLILMDVQMPVMDGYEATTLIRNKFTSPKSEIPIIALTANAIKGDNQKCFDVGMNDYLTKPFRPEDLKDKILSNIPKSDNKLKNKSKNKPKDHLKLPDLKHLQNLCHNDINFMKEIINVFIDSTPVNIEVMEKSLKEDNYEQLKKDAHKLKSSISFIGLKSAVPIIKEIELLADNESNRDRIEENLALFKDMVHKTIDHFVELLPRLK